MFASQPCISAVSASQPSILARVPNCTSAVHLFVFGGAAAVKACRREVFSGWSVTAEQIVVYIESMLGPGLQPHDPEVRVNIMLVPAHARWLASSNPSGCANF